MTKSMMLASIASTLLLVTPARAECGKYECSNVRVLAHYVDANGNALVQLSGRPWRLSCKPTRFVYVKVPSSGPDGRDLFTHLAAYQLMDQPITVQVDPDAKECRIDHVVKVEP